MIITQWESTLLVGGHRIEQLSYYLEKPLFIGLHFVSSEIFNHFTKPSCYFPLSET